MRVRASLTRATPSHSVREKGCSNIKTCGEHHQKWQRSRFQDGSLMADVVEADSQAERPPTGAAVPGARLRPGARGAPGKLQTLQACGVGMLSLLDQWKSRTPRTPGSVHNTQGTDHAEAGVTKLPVTETSVETAFIQHI